MAGIEGSVGIEMLDFRRGKENKALASLEQAVEVIVEVVVLRWSSSWTSVWVAR